MPRKTDSDDEKVIPPVEPVEEIITLKLKQRAYWRGELCEPGRTFDYPKSKATEILTTTELFTAA